MTTELGRLEAAVFDLDGVITFTARVHAAAWKQLFDEYLRARAARLGETFQPFDIHSDYSKYVDGKPRYDGVSSFLQARGIQLPWGTPADSPAQETICGLGNRKDILFNAKIRELGVDVDWEAVRLVRELRARDVRVGLASSSKNAVPILERAGLAGLFEATVDGRDSERLGLRGKPEPDIFLLCLQKLHEKSAAAQKAVLAAEASAPARDLAADPRLAMVVEDAIAGVQAGRRGGFGLVLGVDREHQSAALEENGADMVIRDFREISAARVLEYFRSRAA
jgi:alpha,alpha-trehalase